MNKKRRNSNAFYVQFLKTLSIIGSVIVLPFIKVSMPMTEKDSEIAFWRLHLKSMLKSPTTIKR